MKQKSLFKNSIYKAILTIVNIIIPIFIGPYIARVLDIGLYGQYNKAYSEMQVFLIFAAFGVYNFGVREISKIRDDKKKVSQLFTSLFVISLISNIIVLALYLIYSASVSSGTNFMIYALIGLQIVGNIFYMEFVNEALENFKFITIKTFIVRLLYFLAIILFVKKPDDIIPYSLIIGLTVLINNLISYVIIKKHIKFDFKNIKIKKYIIPLFYVLIISNIDLLYTQLDKIMLGQFSAATAVTEYYIPYYIVSTVTSIPAAMITVSIPRLGYIIKNEGKKVYEETINKILSPYMFFIIPMCMGMFVLAKEIIVIYGSEKYLATVMPFAVMCLFRIVISIGNFIVHLIMYPNNKEKSYIKFSLTCGIINLIANFALVYFDILSPLTAFITTGIAETILVIMQMIYIKTKMKVKFNIFTKKNLLYLGLSLLFIPIAIIVKLINFGFYINIIIIMALCCAVYGLTLLLIKDENVFFVIDKAKNIINRLVVKKS